MVSLYKLGVVKLKKNCDVLKLKDYTFYQYFVVVFDLVNELNYCELSLYFLPFFKIISSGIRIRRSPYSDDTRINPSIMISGTKIDRRTVLHWAYTENKAVP